MGPTQPSRELRTLAAIAPGSKAEIRTIIFNGIRTACEDAGVREGDVVLCRDRGEQHILLETSSGRTAALDTSWGRFIEVDVVERSAGSRESRLADPAPAHTSTGTAAESVRFL